VNKELVVQNDFDTLQRQANALYSSGYFKDVNSKAKAIVKVMAGAELGLPPFASMSGIHIIKGKPVLGANIIATLVKNDPRYDYWVKLHDNEICTLVWEENGKRLGECSFTIEEAKNAGLTDKDNWKNYASDMLFARAVSRGARRFAPGIFGGVPVYTPDEFNVSVDSEGYIEGTVESLPAPQGGSAGYEVVETFDTDLNPVNVDTATGEIVEPITYGERPTAANMPKMPTEKQHKRFHAIGASAYGDKWNAKRAAMVKHLKLATSKDLTLAQMDTLIEGIEAKANGN